MSFSKKAYKYEAAGPYFLCNWFRADRIPKSPLFKNCFEFGRVKNTLKIQMWKGVNSISKFEVFWEFTKKILIAEKFGKVVFFPISLLQIKAPKYFFSAKIVKHETFFIFFKYYESSSQTFCISKIISRMHSSPWQHSKLQPWYLNSFWDILSIKRSKMIRRLWWWRRVAVVAQSVQVTPLEEEDASELYVRSA